MDDGRFVELTDPLAEFLGALPPGGTFRYRYADAVKLSGHSCPTVAGAFVMTCAALDALYPEGRPVRGDIEVVVGGEPSGASAGPMSQVIALITGAATETGFGGLAGRWRRRGLLTFDPSLGGRIRFRRLDTNAAVDVEYDSSPIPPAPELRALLSAALVGVASAEEAARFRAAWLARVDAILADPARVVRLIPVPMLRRA